MSVKKCLGEIIDELAGNQRLIDDDQADRFCGEILSAGHIFTAGAGRSGTAVKAFTNRLMHLGFSVSMVGEISSPHSKPGDLVIILSGSGETASLTALARKAKDSGCRISLITMYKGSAIAKLADTVVVIPGVSPKIENAQFEVTSVQPMGSAFEQLSFLTCDAVVLELMRRTGQSNEEMFERHADFE